MHTVTTRPTTRRRPGTPRALMQLRTQWTQQITAGLVECRRCHTPIRPGQKWELGHPVNAPYATGNTDQGLAPEHSSCNKTGLIVDQPPTFGW